ncbi:MAG: hypothetical protein ACO3F3_15705, partial [Gemmataceae bacterium]
MSKELRFLTQPSGARYGVPLVIQPVIEVVDVELDTNGNKIYTRDTNYQNVLIVIEGLISGGGNSGYNLFNDTPVAFVNGVATFTNLGLEPDSTNTVLDVRPASLIFYTADINAIQSEPFTISNASKLFITTDPLPTSALTNRPIKPLTVQVQEQNGDNVSLPNVLVTVTANGGVTLSGTTTGSTDSTGKVVFNNLVVSGGAETTLTFSALGLAPATLNLIINPVDIIKPKRSEVTGKLPTT